MSDKIKKRFGLEIKSKDSEKREITVIGSQLGVDRDKDIVDIKTMDLKQFKSNPVVLWSHRSGEPPIGKALTVSKAAGNTQLKFKIQFAKEEEYEFADTIYKLTKAGYINASSIGFSVNYEKSEYDKDRGGYNLNNSELLEISLVNVPANADALITQRSFEKALEDKVITKDELDLFNLKMDQDTTQEDVENSEQTINDILTAMDDIKIEVEDLKSKIAELQIKNVKEETPSYIDDLFSNLGDELDVKSNDSSNTSGKVVDSDLDDILNKL